jgi:hypothetical protein
LNIHSIAIIQTIPLPFHQLLFRKSAFIQAVPSQYFPEAISVLDPTASKRPPMLSSITIISLTTANAVVIQNVPLAIPLPLPQLLVDKRANMGHAQSQYILAAITAVKRIASKIYYLLDASSRQNANCSTSPQHW